ncbi:MAG: AMP-binding protein, partial [bacterium]|nr:AMP-binding protein [bacterium]
NPTQRIYDIPLLSEKENHQLLYAWNETQKEYPKDKCVHELFEEYAEKTPEQTAVVFENESLTYYELNVQANRLAHYLIERGINPDTLVGICVERSLKMIVGVLGILKAGGAYVPIDPGYPQTRIQYMLEDSDIQELLTQESLLKQLPLNEFETGDINNTQNENLINLFCLDTKESKALLQDYPDNNPNPQQLGVTSSHLAYVIYTSGSTGQPKGVLLEHRGLSNTASSQ